jgi:hypothetical protein
VTICCLRNMLGYAGEKSDRRGMAPSSVTGWFCALRKITPLTVVALIRAARASKRFHDSAGSRGRGTSFSQPLAQWDPVVATALKYSAAAKSAC